MSWYRFDVHQGDTIVASASAANREAAKREADHYAFMYGQDGPVKVVERKSYAHKPAHPKVKP